MLRQSAHCLLTATAAKRVPAAATALAMKQQQRFNTHFFSFGNLGLQVIRNKNNDHYHADPGHDTDIWKAEELRGPGMKSADAVPTPFEVSTGKERVEYLSLLEGKDPYHGLMDPLVIEAKGTKAKPIEVLSPDEDRVIGCQGYPGNRHHAMWIHVSEVGHKYWEFGHNRCSECGNSFKLKRIELPFPSIN